MPNINSLWFAPPTDIIEDMGGPKYDPLFAQKTLNPAGMVSLIYWNDFYWRPQPVSVARQTAGYDFRLTFGRPMGNFLQGPYVVSTPMPMPSRFADPFLPGGAPSSIGAWAKTVTGQIMQRRGKV